MSPPNCCQFCNKKIGITGIPCGKCDMKFCASHIQCELHNCTYDHKKAGKELLRKQLDVGKLVEKVTPI